MVSRLTTSVSVVRQHILMKHSFTWKCLHTFYESVQCRTWTNLFKRESQGLLFNGRVWYWSKTDFWSRWAKEVRAKIQQAIGPYEDLPTTVKRRKLQWYGHVSRSSCLAKTILQGTVKWGRRQGRQRKSWEDNIREWTGLEFGKSQRAVENREKWRKLFVKSSVVRQRPSRLRDRWWWCHTPQHWAESAVSLCFEPSQPQRTISGLKTNLNISPCYSFHES